MNTLAQDKNLVKIVNKVKADKAQANKTTKQTKTTGAKKAVTQFKDVYTVEDYKSLSKSKGVFRGYTVASMLTLGLIKLTATGSAKGKQARKADFKVLVGATACNHWIKSERLTVNDKGMITVTAKGLTAINESLAGQAKGGYNTSKDVVNAIVGLFAKGGTLSNPNGVRIDMRTKAAIAK